MPNYVVSFSAYKKSGKYYSGQYHTLFESGINSEVIDLPQIIDLIEILKQDLDRACGLVSGSIKANEFDVVINVYNENFIKQEDRGLLTQIVRWREN